MTVQKKKEYNQKRIQQKVVIKAGGFGNDYDKRTVESTSQTDERKEY